jgi:uncharacterized damage-inducible protein DinB
MDDPRYPIGRFAPPEVFTAESRAACIAAIEAAPSALYAAVRGLTPEQLLTPYREGGWSVAQVVHHVADSHVNAYIRFKLAVSADNPLVKAYDENAWARFPDAVIPNLDATLGLLGALHARWVPFLKSLEAAQFGRTYQHSEMGPVALDRALALYAWHGAHHTAHVTALRARLGW